MVPVVVTYLSLGSTLQFQLHIVDYSGIMQDIFGFVTEKKNSPENTCCRAANEYWKCREVLGSALEAGNPKEKSARHRYHCFAWHRYGGNVHRTTRDMALLLRNALMRGRGHIEGRGSLGWGSKKLPIGR